VGFIRAEFQERNTGELSMKTGATVTARDR